VTGRSLLVKVEIRGLNVMSVQSIQTHISLPVRGMTCAACSTRLEKVLSRLDGVVDVSVSLATELADIRFDGSRIGGAVLVEAIAKAGFSVAEDTIELAIGGMTCAACSTRLEKVLGKVAWPPNGRRSALPLARWRRPTWCWRWKKPASPPRW
jgi:copper ion binding protein